MLQRRRGARDRALLLTHLHSVAPSSLLGEALHYLHGQWPKLVRFVDNGTWPLGSSPMENAIRPFVVGRRSWLFADTVGGANASANLYSLIEIARPTASSPTGPRRLVQEAAAGADRRRLRGAAALEHRTRRTVERPIPARRARAWFIDCLRSLVEPINV